MGINVFDASRIPPAFCHSCGKALPWTAQALQSAKDFAQIKLSNAECNELADIIENLVRDTSRTTVAATQFKLMMAKYGPAVAEGFKTILINVLTEATKRKMFPGA